MPYCTRGVLRVNIFCSYYYSSSGTLPIYMGAPNIEDWLPGENSVIRTDEFSGAKELSEYINYLDEVWCYATC